jgi:hypothetical protein
VRNLQITGNDIEYNNHRVHRTEPVPVADIFIDGSRDEASVRELTIASNTVQATPSPSGANIRVIGREGLDHEAVGMMTITGNVIGSQETGVHLVRCRDVSLTGNFIYASTYRNLHVERSRGIVIGSNTVGHNPDGKGRELAGGVRVEGSRFVNFNGMTIRDAEEGRHTVAGVDPVARDGLVEIVRCRAVSLTGCQVVDGSPCGVDVRDSTETVLSACTIIEKRPAPTSLAAVRWSGDGSSNLVSACLLGRGKQGATLLDGAAGVRLQGNTEAGG